MYHVKGVCCVEARILFYLEIKLLLSKKIYFWGKSVEISIFHVISFGVKNIIFVSLTDTSIIK
jgi:hypothetical protein